MVMPLHADISVRCRRVGFDYLTPILWHKIANATLEVENGSSFLGKPYEPNAIIKNDTEYILMLRKPGGWGRLEVPATMTENDWERMLESVRALRIGFVAESDQDEK